MHGWVIEMTHDTLVSRKTKAQANIKEVQDFRRRLQYVSSIILEITLTYFCIKIMKYQDTCRRPWAQESHSLLQWTGLIALCLHSRKIGYMTKSNRRNQENTTETKCKTIYLFFKSKANKPVESAYHISLGPRDGNIYPKLVNFIVIWQESAPWLQSSLEISIRFNRSVVINSAFTHRTCTSSNQKRQLR